MWPTHYLYCLSRVINDTRGGRDLVVFHVGGTASVLDARSIADSDDVGATGVFDPNLDGRKLTFRKDGEQIFDNETGSEWNVLGQAIAGELAGHGSIPSSTPTISGFRGLRSSRKPRFIKVDWEIEA